MEDRILKLLGRRDYKPSTADELLRRLGLHDQQQEQLQQLLTGLERSGKIVRTKSNRYIQAREAGLVPGIIRINRQGRGFLQAEDTSLQEIMIPESATGTALHGDRVLVRRDEGGRPPPRADGGRKGGSAGELTGAVVRILERKRTQIAGTLQKGRQFMFVIPDDPRIPHDIYVSTEQGAGKEARLGDKVVVELRDWQSRHTNPEGEIVEVLGSPDAEGVDMLSVLRQYNLPVAFPGNVFDAAGAIAGGPGGAEVQDSELQGRVDCRAHNVVTIDPDDAKDFDDAICLEALAGGRWKLWVHIADVSHYVKPGGALDVEARKRGNSTYLVDRVIPMLPEALSNELCSLKPDRDRLTKCVEFVLSPEGRVTHAKFYPAVIRSKRRFTYKEALAVLQDPRPVGKIEQMLHHANQLAQHIRRARFKTGSLDLDFPETKIRLDAHGKVRLIERVENDVSHQLIEEFMLLANEAVAGELMARHRPAVYRVHEAPNELRLREYREDVLSHNIPCGNLSKRGEVQRLLQRLSAVPIGAALKIGLLRSLMRARYAVEALGHYGLSKTRYTHFTSPIRRYADLVVHRALFAPEKMSILWLKETAEHISETERNSSDAERDSKEIKLFAFLNTQLESGSPQVYSALVTELRNFGFFVNVPELGLSGLVHLSSVPEDFFVFDEQRNQLLGRRTRRVVKMGDKVMVCVYKVDRFKKQVDFQWKITRNSSGNAPTKELRRRRV